MIRKEVKLLYGANNWESLDSGLLKKLEDLNNIPISLRDVYYYKIISEYFVKCGVTNNIIPLEDLSYWNVEKQIPFKDYKISLQFKLNKRQ